MPSPTPTGADDENDDWKCVNCGSEDPHDALTLHDEIEVDVTCESVYITPTDGGPGFAFDHDKFEAIIEHYEQSDFTADT